MDKMSVIYFYQVYYNINVKYQIFFLDLTNSQVVDEKLNILDGQVGSSSKFSSK